MGSTIAAVVSVLYRTIGHTPPYTFAYMELSLTHTTSLGLHSCALCDRCGLQLLVSIVCAAGQSPPSTLPLVCPPPPPPSLPVNPPWCPPLGGMNTVLAANTSRALPMFEAPGTL